MPTVVEPELLARLDELLSSVDTATALKAVRSFEKVLERRLEVETRPLDLFTLPQDLPTWEELYADLVERAIVNTGSLSRAAKAVGIGRSTLYNQIHRGILHERAKNNPDLASAIESVLGTAEERAPRQRRQA